jgi:cholesterol transport system auxiliary component
MQKTIQTVFLILAISGSALITGCATGKQATALYDFGPVRSASAAPISTASALPPISVADIGTPAWLDNTMMFYRLAYANEHQPRPYANSRWSMPPTQLFAQRLKSRIAQAGGVALPASDGAANVPVLRIEADDFMQMFEAPGQSSAHVAVRAALFNGRTLLAQRTFVKQSPAPTADAAGGARALATASDEVIGEMMTWLASLPSTSRQLTTK